MSCELAIRFAVMALALQFGQLSAQDAPSEVTPVRFQRDIAPILRDRCVGCHDGNLQMATLRLDTRQAMLNAGVVVPGDASQSLLITRTHDRELGLLMPPTGRLDPSEIALLKSWVDGGAEWPNEVKLESSSTGNVDALTTALFAVIRSNDLFTAGELLKDMSLLRRVNQHGASPLMQAALHSKPEILQLIIDRGADVNVRDNDGMTALMLAAGDPVKVKLLLAHGADVHAKSKLGRTALLLASAYAGNRDAVAAMLNAGADVNFSDQRNWSALVLAARTGDTELVGYLIEAGADVHGGNSKRRNPGSPLMQAAWAGDATTAQLLLSKGAGTDQRSLDTALIFAATHGNLPMTRLLLDAGANPDANVVTNYVPESPILAASYSDALPTEIVRMLLQREVDVSRKDKRGESPLSIAKQRGNSEVLRLLTEASGQKLDAGVTTGDDGTAQDARTKSSVIRELVQTNVKRLQSCGEPFFANSGCVACHQQTSTSLVVPMARDQGFQIDDQGERQQVKLTAADLQRSRVGFLQRMKVGGSSHRLGYLLWGLSAAGYPADEVTDATFIELSGLQLNNGSWVSDAHRPPTEYSPVTATAVAIRAIDAYSPPGHAERTKQRITLATQWLQQVDAFANAEKAFRLLGLRWGGGSEETIAEATATLLSDQHPNGGWSQLPSMPPDAYATGLTLYALSAGGRISPRDDAYRNGVEFLVNTSQEDGSWHVPSRSFAIQPYFESGFPYEHDQWISAAATGWACMALMQVTSQDDALRIE